MVDTDDPTQFRGRLEDALRHHFGWADAAVLDEPPAGDGGAGPQQDAPRVFHARRATSHGGPRTAMQTKVVGTVLDNGAERLYVSVALADAEGVARQQAILERLGRHLIVPVKDTRQDATAELSLTRREREVAGLVAAGLTNDQIAERMHITIGTVKKHLSQALAKADCTSRTQLAVLLQ